ncbi:MAG: glutamate--tRNA ligase [Candidatus Curtissbacteria bacterium]|nr:glutamate--tRNA ligase [Candidatus Curtissbacteria bacterium]
MSKVIDPKRSRVIETLSLSKGRRTTGPERSRRIRVRYAPSPTGIPHIGNIRTALFNYLFAKNQNGDFLLRIEDTDQNRLIPESVEKIKESLELLGLKWDEEEHQSKRLEIYKKHLDILKGKDLAYEDDGAWRFKVEKGKTLQWDDVVHGQVKFSSDVIEDFIIIKSDGFPTYHFASVVDDHDMQISHVFRGDEWISSTPKHLLIYQAFGWEPPKFVHLPPILGADHKKLSKREGAKSVIEYIEEGYLPEAIVNFLAFLGWSPKDDREIFSLEELTREFSLDRINKNSPIFNLEKLNWFNSQWLRRLPQKELSKKIKKAFPRYDPKIVGKLTPLIQKRITNVNDFPKLCNFFFEVPKPLDSVVEKGVLSKVAENFVKVSWNAEEIKNSIEDFAQSQKVDKKDLIVSIRNIVAGRPVTPPLYESLEILGKDETIARLKKYVS